MLSTMSSAAEPGSAVCRSVVVRTVLAAPRKSNNGWHQSLWIFSFFHFNGLGRTFFDRRRGLQFSLNWDVFGRFDPKANPVAPDFENRDLEFVGDDDLFVSLATYDEHLTLLCL